MDFRSCTCWIVFIHIIRGHPGGLLQFSKQKAVKIFSASVLYLCNVAEHQEMPDCLTGRQQCRWTLLVVRQYWSGQSVRKLSNDVTTVLVKSQRVFHCVTTLSRAIACRHGAWHMANWILSCCYQISCPRYNSPTPASVDTKHSRYCGVLM